MAGVLLSAVFREFLVEQFYDELHVHLDELQGLMEFDANGQFKLQRPLSDPRYVAPLSGFYWEIQKDGKVLARSTSLEGPILKVPADGGTDAQVHTHSIAGPTGELLIAERLRWLDAGKDPLRIIIGTDKRILDHELEEFNKVLLWSLGGFALSMIGAAVVFLLYAMAPFAHLRTALAKVRSSAAPNLSGKFPEEVQPLIDDLNNLLAASGEQILKARAQAGNIAHGLKTPLAILVDEAHQLALRGEDQSAAIIRDQCRRMQSQIDYQIARARAAASRAKPGTAASLTETASSVMRALQRLYVEGGLRIENDVPAGVTVACEVQDLNEMLANLVDNACKHAKTRVRMRTEDSSLPDFVTVVVEDDGPGLPPEAWEVVFNVGAQWGDRSGGSGLGLPIVRDLVQLYGGSIRLGRSALGGLRVQLELPEFVQGSGR
ncbi:HAMP domain-containing sensor histidine kinase [Hyphomicrobium sp.]|uniref:sensor histidine kinase n=2 Tax=Hyphomicrobium sp. TaxID=82 RepID=UPI0025B8FFA8|nr:HAMP domain-containing sensor histidine kinase [Hyphomicrobium sp.]